MFCSGNRANENVALMELLWFWGEPDSKQGMEMHFYENKGKCYKNYDVTVWLRVTWKGFPRRKDLSWDLGEKQ